MEGKTEEPLGDRTRAGIKKADIKKRNKRPFGQAWAIGGEELSFKLGEGNIQ